MWGIDTPIFIGVFLLLNTLFKKKKIYILLSRASFSSQ